MITCPISNPNTTEFGCDHLSKKKCSVTTRLEFDSQFFMSIVFDGFTGLLCYLYSFFVEMFGSYRKLALPLQSLFLLKSLPLTIVLLFSFHFLINEGTNMVCFNLLTY